MLIDTERLEDFMKRYPCDIDRKAEKLEDMVIYANRNTGRWESVFEQLKLDIELEEKWDELEDVLFIENADGDLALHEDWDKYKAGTLRRYIWADMFEKYSDGAYLIVHPIYNDNGHFTEASKVPEIIKEMFLNREIVIKVNNETDAKTLFRELKTAKNCKKEHPYFYNQKDSYEYDPRYPYYFMDKNEYLNSNTSMKNIVRNEGIRQLVDFKDFDNISKVTEPERDNDIDLEER